MSPLFGPKCVFFFFGGKATACWQWSNFLETRCPVGKEILHINIYESLIPLWWSAQKGFVGKPTRGHANRKRFLREEQKVSLGTRRSAFTLMACICNDPIIQRTLPQVILVN